MHPLSLLEAYSKALSSDEGHQLRNTYKRAADVRVENEAVATETPEMRQSQEWGRLVNQTARENPKMTPSEVWTKVHAKNCDLYTRAKGAA